MSLFSIVQGRVAPPEQQPITPLQPAIAPVPMQRAPLQGFMDGGVMHHDDDMESRVRKIEIELAGFQYGGTIPGYQGGEDDILSVLSPEEAANYPSQAGVTDYIGSGNVRSGSVLAAMREFPYDPNGPWSFDEYMAAIEDLAQQGEEQQAWERAGGAGGADHFYESLAEQARQFDIQRQDEKALADWQAKSTQQQAMLDWRKALADAETARRQTMNQATGQAQDFAASILSQADPAAGRIWFNPSAGYEAMMKAQPPQMEMPNIPGVEWAS